MLKTSWSLAGIFQVVTWISPCFYRVWTRFCLNCDMYFSFFSNPNKDEVWPIFLKVVTGICKISCTDLSKLLLNFFPSTKPNQAEVWTSVLRLWLNCNVRSACVMWKRLRSLTRGCSIFQIGSVDRSASSNVLNLARFIFQIIFAAGIELQLPSCNLFWPKLLLHRSSAVTENLWLSDFAASTFPDVTAYRRPYLLNQVCREFHN